MAIRQRIWAARERDRLTGLMGAKCVDCGTTEKLEFDVIIPLDSGSHHSREWSWRMSFYRQEFERGNLALRCEKCNRKKGNKMLLLTEEPMICPF